MALQRVEWKRHSGAGTRAPSPELVGLFWSRCWERLGAGANAGGPVWAEGVLFRLPLSPIGPVVSRAWVPPSLWKFPSLSDFPRCLVPWAFPEAPRNRAAIPERNLGGAGAGTCPASFGSRPSTSRTLGSSSSSPGTEGGGASCPDEASQDPPWSQLLFSQRPPLTTGYLNHNPPSSLFSKIHFETISKPQKCFR